MDHSEFSKRNVQVSSLVAELLHVHDCIILPGFGGLIGNYAPARVHPVTHVFQAPSKQLVFNRSLKTDDGLLVNEYARVSGLSFSLSRLYLSEYVEKLNANLLAGERIEWTQIGTFNTDVERNIQFKATQSVNYLPESIGLYAIQVQPINRFPVPERRPEPVFVNRELVPPVKVSRKFPVRRVLQAIPVLLIAAFIGVNASLPEGKGISTADLNIFSQSASISASALSVQSPEALPAARKSIPAPVAELFSAESAQIFIVAGCYSTEVNANGMVDYLSEKGFSSYVLDRTPAGLYRVVYGNYPSIQEATDELTSIRKGLNEEAWLLIR
ncbi:MAG TPA: SPOR domain-containing protein [Flavobacteriales bacterium]|nr:SPOR domain-containing protein [Flavobacteriales bacterium]HPH82530.1 SPOR domain-containing protein [Flavobacteriales bacterium]